MAAVAVGAAVESGFRLIRREPVAVLLWGLAQVAFAVGSVTLFAPVYLELIAQAAALSGAGASPPPAVVGDAMRLQGLSWLLTFASLILRAILMCAACRAVQKPTERRLGYLRLGMAEFYLLLIFVGLYLAVMIASVVAVLAFAVLTAVLGLAHALPAAIALDGLAVIVLIVGLVYVSLRFAMIAPLVVEDEKPHLLESWSLTRGHAGALFLIGLCLFGIFVLAETVLGAAGLIIGASALASAVGGLDGLARLLAQPPSAILAAVAPYLVVVAVVGVPLAGCASAIMSAPWARVYLDLTARRTDVRGV